MLLTSSLVFSQTSQIKVLDGEDEYYKLLSTVESIPEEELVTAPSPAPLVGPSSVRPEPHIRVSR